FLVHLRNRACDPESGAIGEFDERCDRLIFSVRNNISVGIERMSGDVKAEQLFFETHLLAIAPWSDGSLARGRDMLVRVPEKRDLSCHSITMCRGRRGQRIVDTGEKLRSFATQKIKRATLDQRFQHFAIGDAGIEPAAKIFQRLEVAAALAFANGKLHRS